MINNYIEEIFQSYSDTIGKAYLPYSNHVHRIALLTLELKENVSAEDVQKIAIAAVHHDIGIWTAHTFDYLEPSIEAAKIFLEKNNLSHWTEEISLIIDMHHKRSVYKGDFQDNVESFRKADLIDVTKGKKTFGVKKSLIKKNFESYPMLDFRVLIVKSFLKNLVRYPFNPLPMMKK